MKKIITSLILTSFLSLSSYALAAESMVGQVNGMMCIKCQKMVTDKLIEVSPTAYVKVSWPEGVAVSAFKSDSNLSEQEFQDAILGTGFEVIKVVKVDKFIEDAGEARKLVD
tara:strand:+ start:1012 stop:1347 length:336 start_codon:yes stop_codon:yes gene_type:complete